MEEQQCRLERLRRQLAEQAVMTRRLRLDSKELRAASSAALDQAIALLLVARGLTRDRTPPIPTHGPTE